MKSVGRGFDSRSRRLIFSSICSVIFLSKTHQSFSLWWWTKLNSPVSQFLKGNQPSTWNRGEGCPGTVREVEMIDMLISFFLTIISTSLTVPGQPSPRFGYFSGTVKLIIELNHCHWLLKLRHLLLVRLLRVWAVEKICTNWEIFCIIVYLQDLAVNRLSPL